MLIPEIIIFNTIKALLKFVKEDWNDNEDKNKTILYHYFGNTSLQRYNLYEQAQAVFLATETSPRYLDINVFFNANRAAIPTIHLTLPSEQSSLNGIGLDEGYVEPWFNEEDISESESLSLSTSESKTTVGYRNKYTRRFDTVHNIVVTSDNINEVLLIYNFLKAALISCLPHFAVLGVENGKIGGNDIYINPQILPPNVFVRALTLASSYELTVPELFDRDVFTDLIFNKGEIL